jgi:hypothetical protein
MLPTKFRFIWPCNLRGKDFLEIYQSETRIACVGHVFNRSGRNEQSKIANLVPISLQTWPPYKAILVSGWSISKKSSPLKLSSQMNRNLVGSTYGRFCMKFPQSRMKGE